MILLAVCRIIKECGFLKFLLLLPFFFWDLVGTWGGSGTGRGKGRDVIYRLNCVVGKLQLG